MEDAHESVNTAKYSDHKFCGPPYFKDLNPIEILWAYVKRNVAD